VALAQRRQVEVDAQPATCLDCDAADTEDESNLALREVVDHLVRGQTIFVQPTGLLCRIKNNDLVPETGCAVSEGQPGGSRPHHRDAKAARGGPREWVARRPGHQAIHCVPLEKADLDRRAFSLVHDANALAQNLGRTGPGAGPAHDIVRKNRSGRAVAIAAADLVNEFRDIDPGRARIHARRVVAVEASGCLHEGLRNAQRPVQIGEVLPQLRRRR